MCTKRVSSRKTVTSRLTDNEYPRGSVPPAYLLCGWVDHRKLLIRMTSLLSLPRVSASFLPSCDQAKSKICPDSKFVICFGAPPPNFCRQMLVMPLLVNAYSTASPLPISWPRGGMRFTREIHASRLAETGPGPESLCASIEVIVNRGKGSLASGADPEVHQLE